MHRDKYTYKFDTIVNNKLINLLWIYLKIIERNAVRCQSRYTQVRYDMSYNTEEPQRIILYKNVSYPYFVSNTRRFSNSIHTFIFRI